MRLLVTGREGQLARALAERGPAAGVEILTVARPQLDLAGPPEEIIETIKQNQPEVIVSAAAYTAVDRAESEPERAFAVNERGAGAVARAAARLGVPLIHISTDYVFDGTKSAPYREEDETGPSGIYGASKLAGERAVSAEQPDSAILRTAWVYSPWGANFVKTMLRLAAERHEISVVADQRGNPTSAIDIADGVLAVARNLTGERDPRQRGTFHITAAGEASWAEFAEAIFAASAREGGPTATVKPITTSAYPTAARRPSNSRLENSRLQAVHGVILPDWSSSLQEVVSRLVGSA